MNDEKDKALALSVVREIDAAFESSERLRLGKWVLPDEREQTIALFIAKALTTVRQEERERLSAVLKRWCKCGPRISCSFCAIRRELEAAANENKIDPER